MCGFVLLAVVYAIPLNQKQTSANRNYLRAADGFAAFPHLQYDWLVSYEPTEICSQLWNSQAVQDLGVDFSLQRAFLFDLQRFALDFRVAILLCGTWS